jgi:hypothetical protein
MQGDVDQEVPVGTLGNIIQVDNEDSDLWTYEVAWDNGVTGTGMREYNMEPADESYGGDTPIQPQSYLARYEAKQAAKSVPAVFASILRLRAYLRQAADQRPPAEIIAEFKQKIVPMLDNFTYQRLDTGEQIIIPDGSNMWNSLHTGLDRYHDLLRPYMDQPDVAAVVREIEEYAMQIQLEDTPKDNLAKLKDTPTAYDKYGQEGIVFHDEASDVPDSGWAALLKQHHQEALSNPELGDEAEDVMAKIPTEAPAMDELLDRWNQAQSADQKAQIERRIKELHEKMLHAYLLSQKRI